MIERVREVYRYRRALVHLISRDIRLKYQGTRLGYLWSLFEPLLLTSIYFLVFSLIGRFGIENYGLFLIVALLPWLWFNAAMIASATSLTGQGRLVARVYLPREVQPLAVVGAKAFEFVASTPVIVLFAFILGVGPSWYLAAFPLAFLMEGALLIGLTLFVAATNVLMRDVDRLMRILLRALFYISPIIYPTITAWERLPKVFDILYWFNPLAGILELYRAAWFPGYFPGWGLVAASGAISFIVLVGGWWVFARLEPLVLKEL